MPQLARHRIYEIAAIVGYSSQSNFTRNFQKQFNMTPDAKDRKYQFWERNALSVELNTLEMLKQKLEYIHYNRVEAGLCSLPKEYKYSTARFYETGINDWRFVTH